MLKIVGLIIPAFCPVVYMGSVISFLKDLILKIKDKKDKRDLKLKDNNLFCYANNRRIYGEFHLIVI